MTGIQQRNPTATRWAAPGRQTADTGVPGQSDWFLQSLISLVTASTWRPGCPRPAGTIPVCGNHVRRRQPPAPRRPWTGRRVQLG